MIYGKRALIYIPGGRGKKINKVTNIVNPTEVLGSVFTGCSYFNFNTYNMTQTPLVCRVPGAFGYALQRTNAGVGQADRKLSFIVNQTSVNDYAQMVPIPTGVCSARYNNTNVNFQIGDIENKAAAMRWGSVWPGFMTDTYSATFRYAYFVCVSSNDVARIIDSSHTGNQILLAANSENVTVNTSFYNNITMRFRKFNDTNGVISSIVSALRGNHFNPDESCSLWFTTEEIFPTDQMLIDYCNKAMFGFFNNIYESNAPKSGVVTIDLSNP